MKEKTGKVATLDEYIKLFPRAVSLKLEKIRLIVKKIAPKSTEGISYGMPTFKLNNKNLVHFAAYEGHIGFYPTPSGVNEFKNELVKYKTSKGAIQFPLDEALPFGIIQKLVKFRVKEVLTNSKK